MFSTVTPAFAQPAQSPPPAGPQATSSSPVQEVTVTARKSGYSSGIDARSYGLGSDLKSSTGALADVLRDVPSVQVDTEGNVSLRGDSNVTILVDGKPSALFSGPGRAPAIQAMSADQFERVEVMTNPSAGQTAEGSGGVINLISKRPPKGRGAPTYSGTLKAEVGSGGRYDLGGSSAFSVGGLSLNGGVDYRRGAYTRTIDTRYGIPDTLTGQLSPADQTQSQRQHDDDLTLNGSIGYDVDPSDHFDVAFTSEVYREARDQAAKYNTEAASGPLALDYLSPAVHDDFLASNSESFGVTHTLPGNAQSLSAKLALSQGHESVTNAAEYDYTTPVQPSLYQAQTRNSDFPELDIKVDYKTTLDNKATLTFGYEGRFDWQSETEHGLQGVSVATAVGDADYAEHFNFNQQVHALYVTYEQTIGRMTVRPGIRVEYTALTTDLVSAAEMSQQSYLEAFPSLHLDYAFDKNTDVKASYGRRIQRPDEYQLNPFRIESSVTLYTAGNPDLKPAITQSWELGFEYRKKTTDFQSTLFYRDKSNVFTTVQTDLGGNVLLSTSEKLGWVRNAGVELALNKDVLKGLSLNASTDLQHSEANAGNVGIAGTRTAFVASGRATMSWQVRSNDFLQLGAQASGRELTAQGYFGGAIFSDFGWRHRFSSRVSTAITAQDPFGLSRRTIETDTPSLVDVQKRKFNYTAIFFNLSYALGGAPAHSGNSFDFGSHPGGS